MAKLSAETQARIRDLKDKFPVRRSAVLPSLHYAQAELGYLDDPTLIEVAELLEVPPSMTNEVVSFYTMFDRQRRGTYKIEVCRNLSCALMGAKQLTQHLEKKLGVAVGGTTPDGRFTLLETECLGACGYAPMLMIGPHFYENLTREKVDAIVGALAEDREPPVPPAGYPEHDGMKPKPLIKSPTA
ncbi:MAG TPA: NAD(P)H-dependent oxidoreductase subunit E, partial [Candidatus Eisenbacteria bacterium]|nr:NAD(P)H-dependent oxidoreductase subunit E [Candidatus Eisenbacteria bacterium]